MAGDWRQNEWGDIATLEYGKSLRDYRAKTGQYCVYGTNGPIGWHDEPLCMHPSVIVGRKGAYRGIHFSPEPFFVIDTAFYLEPKQEMDLRWAYYCLLTYDINGMDSGSAIPSTSRESFYRLPVCVPPLKEQRAIAHILGTLDDKIEMNRRMNETLEAMARALFKSWFVNFDPVRARQTGGDPGLPKQLADLFPDCFEDSELGEIPNGWRVGAIGDMAQVSSGKRPDVRYSEASEIANVPLWGGNGPMGFVPEPLIDYPILLTGRVGTLGSVFRITSPCWPSDNTLILCAKEGQAFEYLFFQLRRIEFSTLNRGSTQPLLTQTDLKAQRLLLPPAGLLARFHVVAESLYRRIVQADKESRTLAALRNTLLPKLISGELPVKDAERFIEGRQ